MRATAPPADQRRSADGPGQHSPLPRRSPLDIDAPDLHAKPTPDVAVDGDHVAPWVLVVEDDAKFADVLDRFLASAGYAARVAYSGDTALRALLTPGAVAIVLDVMIPHPDGIEVCRQLRRTSWKGPIIAMSARTGPIHEAAIADAGADRFLVKPFALSDLADALASLTGRAPVVP